VSSAYRHPNRKARMPAASSVSADDPPERRPGGGDPAGERADEAAERADAAAERAHDAAERADTAAKRARAAAAGSRAAEDRALFARYLDKRDPIDRDMLIERFLPLARQLARRYQRPEEPFDDLFQVACLGLVKAIDRFDLDREVAFSSYAVPTILGEIKRYFRDRTWSVRVPRDLQELALKVDRAVAELSLALHRQPTVEEIAERVGADEEDVLEALEASGAYRATSLEAPRGSEDEAGDTLGDTLGTEEEGFALAEHRATIAHLMRSLSPREREVLRLRFEEDMTQGEIGERIGVSQMQVSRIIRQSLGRLRAFAAAERKPSDP
jgi:RNA polymerase sigma-B factor